jgi:hypothetical protein
MSTTIEHTSRTFAFRDRSAGAALEADVIALLRSLNRGGAAGLVVPGEYLETASQMEVSVHDGCGAHSDADGRARPPR